MGEWHFKDLSELTLMDDYMFGAVMQDPVIAKALLEHILNKKLRRIEYVEPQRTLKERYASRAVRLDLYIEDEAGNLYNVEIQTTDKRNLPRRMRYYQSIIDLHILSPGADYQSLRPCYVIFICNYDPFGLGRCVYTFENRCLEAPGLGFGDDTVKVVVNTRGTQPDISDELRETLRYFDSGTVSGAASAALDRAVNHIKNSEERRREYMVMLAWEMEKLEEGLRKGMEKGMEKGMKKGMEKGMEKGRELEADLYNALVQKLLSMNRSDDLIHATRDKDYRMKLCRELGIL